MFLAVKILVPGETGNGIGQMLSLRHPKSGMCNKSLSQILSSVFYLTNFLTYSTLSLFVLGIVDMIYEFCFVLSFKTLSPCPQSLVLAGGVSHLVARRSLINSDVGQFAVRFVTNLSEVLLCHQKEKKKKISP